MYSPFDFQWGCIPILGIVTLASGDKPAATVAAAVVPSASS